LNPRSRAALAYAAATGLGLVAAWLTLPLATLAGDGGLWTHVGSDSAMSLAGHLAYQAPGWHWPPLRAPNLFWPRGLSILLTDSNPAISLLAKGLATWRGHPANLLGAWLGLCWVLQPVAAVYALRGWRQDDAAPSLEASLAVAALSLLCPAWLFRHHINLLGHFLLLAALGLSLRLVRAEQPRLWWQAGVLLTIAILVHPYVFAFAALMLTAGPIHHLLEPTTRHWRACLPFALACATPLAVVRLLGGPIQSGAPGFTHYSMNLVSPFWPQRSGLFGANLPIIDATGGQYEGFNYAGAGVLLLLATAGSLLIRRPPPSTDKCRRERLSITIALAALTLLALTPRIYAGSWLILPLPAQPWAHLFGAVQSSGRAFWLVGYALMIGAVCTIDRALPRSARIALFAAAAGLQFIDTTPLRADDATFFAGNLNPPPPFTIPREATLLRIVPACDPQTDPADQLRAIAARQGLRLADMRAARMPPGLDCEAIRSDGLETPLTTGEIRVFLPSVIPQLRTEALGTTHCTSVLTVGGPLVVCSQDLPEIASGSTPPAGRPIPILPSSTVAPLLAAGWHIDAHGLPWSDGPRATLLFRLPDAYRTTGARLTIHIDAIAAQQGGSRQVTASLDGRNPATLTLPDQQITPFTLTVPPDLAAGVIRVVFDLRRPLDPARRKITAPSSRVAIRLYSVEAAK
jgi:hypothetical protein